MRQLFIAFIIALAVMLPIALSQSLPAPIYTTYPVYIDGNLAFPLVSPAYSHITATMKTNATVDVVFPDGYSATLYPAVYLTHSWNQSKGPYDIEFSTEYPSPVNYTRGPTQALVTIGLNTTPFPFVNPLNITNFTVSNPIGVASYGIYNSSGSLSGYQIKTDRIVGWANITSIRSYNATPPVNESPYNSSLQLNAQMVVVTPKQTYTYWLQNVFGLDTLNNEYLAIDNIWNNTSLNGTISNSTLIGNGEVVQNSTTGPYYFYNTTNYNYTLPLHLIPVIQLDWNGTQPLASFGYINYTSGKETYYDNVTFNMTGATDEYLLVTPYSSALDNESLYDAEFVFGGSESGEAVNFSSMNASMWIYYSNAQDEMVPFPTAYMFGFDTGETASNLTVSISDSLAHVTTGTPSYGTQLSVENLSYIPPGLIPGVHDYTSTSTVSSTSTATSTAATVATTAPATTTATNSSSQSGVSVQSGLVTALVYAFAALLIVLIIIYLLMRRKRMRRSRVSRRRVAAMRTSAPIESGKY